MNNARRLECPINIILAYKSALEKRDGVNWRNEVDKLIECLKIYDDIIIGTLSSLYIANMNLTDGLKEKECRDEMHEEIHTIKVKLSKVLKGKRSA